MTARSWPRRACPETAGPRYDVEIVSTAQLRIVRAELRSWLPGEFPAGDDTFLDDLLLTVDELASNGLRHGRPPVRVSVIATPEGLLLAVSDGDPHHEPEPAVGRDPARGGMGLNLIADLSTSRGWEIRGDRKHVWACLPRE